jgi:hypothetical protein
VTSYKTYDGDRVTANPENLIKNPLGSKEVMAQYHDADEGQGEEQRKESVKYVDEEKA